MKIEKVNDNQIRCILTPGDLIKRHLSIKSIAQGDQAAQALVREMMEQSSEEFGFEPNEFPLLVELSPAEGGGIALTVTKVNSMDEIPISA
ncbi:MAG: adaptor protein MecA, partial [Lachnospiraceae bacterium]|nr:adaptor protein MecA [Lachnospiraceae bacterium]